MRRALVTVRELALTAALAHSSCCSRRPCVLVPAPPPVPSVEQTDRLAHIDDAERRRASAERNLEAASRHLAKLERDRQVLGHTITGFENGIAIAFRPDSNPNASEGSVVRALRAKVKTLQERRDRFDQELPAAMTQVERARSDLRAIESELATALVQAADAERLRIDAMKRRGETPTPETIKLAADLYLRAATLAGK